MMNVEDILSRLQGVRRSGAGHIAKCPAHDDSAPSLRVDVTEERILLHCWAGCDTESVIRALRLEWGDLFFDGRRPVSRSVIRRRPLTTERLLKQVTRPEGLIEFRVAWALVKMFDGRIEELAVTYREEWDEWAAASRFGMGGGPSQSAQWPLRVGLGAARTNYPTLWPAPHINIFAEACRSNDLDPLRVLDWFLLIVDCLDPIPAAA